MRCGPGTTISVRSASIRPSLGSPLTLAEQSTSGVRRNGLLALARAPTRKANHAGPSGARPLDSRCAANVLPTSHFLNQPVKEQHLMMLVARAFAGISVRPGLPGPLQRRRVLQLPHQGTFTSGEGDGRGARPRSRFGAPRRSHARLAFSDMSFHRGRCIGPSSSCPNRAIRSRAVCRRASTT